MQSTHKISGDAASGFAAYLTEPKGRGDYYVGGEADREMGRWQGSPEALGALGLTPGTAVERDALGALMNGRHPETGAAIRPVGGDGSRVAGIDLTFSARKSVSALWAVSGPYRRAQIEAAHRGAIGSAMRRVEREVELVRRREKGVLRWEPARSLVRAEFVHTSSRLTRGQEADGVPDPQLHSHVVVVGAERRDGVFAAVDSRELFRSARVNGAWYRAELAYSLGELGLDVRGGQGKDGRYFEVAGVPTDLARRWSARTEDIERAARTFRERYGREPRAGELGAMTVATRGTKTALAQVDVDQAWRAVGEEHGLSRGRSEALFGEQARHESRPVGTRLLEAVARDRSMVERRELDARAAELAAGTMRPAEAKDVVAELAREGELVELEGGWWTTRELRELEQRTLTLTDELATIEMPGASELALTAAQESARKQLGGPLSRGQQNALETVTAPAGVAVLIGQAGPLADDVQAVITSVQAAERMAGEIKELLVHRLSGVLAAIRQIAVGGPNAVHLAVEALLGTVVLDAERPVDSDRGDADEVNGAGSILKTRRQILQLGAAISAAFALGPKIQDDAAAWKNILEGHIGSPAELAAASEQRQLPPGVAESK